MPLCKFVSCTVHIFSVYLFCPSLEIALCSMSLTGMNWVLVFLLSFFYICVIWSPELRVRLMDKINQNHNVEEKIIFYCWFIVLDLLAMKKALSKCVESISISKLWLNVLYLIYYVSFIYFVLFGATSSHAQGFLPLLNTGIISCGLENIRVGDRTCAGQTPYLPYYHYKFLLNLFWLLAAWIGYSPWDLWGTNC